MKELFAAICLGALLLWLHAHLNRADAPAGKMHGARTRFAQRFEQFEAAQSAPPRRHAHKLQRLTFTCNKERLEQVLLFSIGTHKTATTSLEKGKIQ